MRQLTNEERKIRKLNYRTIEEHIKIYWVMRINIDTYIETLNLPELDFDPSPKAVAIKEYYITHTNVSDPTFEKAVVSLRVEERKKDIRRILLGTQYCYMFQMCEAIEHVLCPLTDANKEKAEVIRLKYFENRLTDAGIAETLHISLKTVWRYKKEVIEDIGNQLGLVI